MAGINSTESKANSPIKFANLIGAISAGRKEDIIDCIDHNNLSITNYEVFVDQCFEKAIYKFYCDGYFDTQQKVSEFLFNKHAEKSIMSKILQSQAVIGCFRANEKLFNIFYNHIVENKISEKNISKLNLIFSKQYLSCSARKFGPNHRPKGEPTIDRIRCITDKELDDVSDELVESMDYWNDGDWYDFNKTMQDYVLREYYNNDQETSSSAEIKGKNTANNKVAD